VLEEKLSSTEEENTLLRKFNEIFGDENDKLTRENELLKEENEKFKKFRIPSSFSASENKNVSRKRSKSCPVNTTKEADEQDDVKARVSFFIDEFLLTNINETLSGLFILDRNETFIKGSNPERVPVGL
jgi:hypothetical protein